MNVNLNSFGEEVRLPEGQRRDRWVVWNAKGISQGFEVLVEVSAQSGPEVGAHCDFILSLQPPSVSRLHPCGGPDTYCIFSGFFLSLLAKICPRIMKSMYSSRIQSGGFWNELATGEFPSNFFFPLCRASHRQDQRTQSRPRSPAHHACGHRVISPAEPL